MEDYIIFIKFFITKDIRNSFDKMFDTENLDYSWVEYQPITKQSHNIYLTIII